MQTYLLESWHCVACGYEQECASAVDQQDGPAPPREGDILLCMSCGHITTVDNAGKTIEPTAKHFQNWKQYPRTWKLVEIAQREIRLRDPIGESHRKRGK